jgi:hypothetical protein
MIIISLESEGLVGEGTQKEKAHATVSFSTQQNNMKKRPTKIRIK